MKVVRSLLLAAAFVTPAFAPAVVHAATPAVSFRAIEYGYADSDHVVQARAALGGAIPAGTPLTAAEAVLSDAGAVCRPSRKQPDTVRCLYHQMSAADESFDDIRWTTRLHVAGNTVSDLTVDRTVDRHGN